MGVEIERKFTVKILPERLEEYPYHVIEQGYLNVHPAIRVRKEDERYYMTYKGDAPKADYIEAKSLNVDAQSAKNIGKTEYNLPLDEASYEHMIAKADGNIIRKKRYLIPLNKDGFDEKYLSENKDIKKAFEDGKIKIELDVFDAPFDKIVIAEVEFPSEDSARAYTPAAWFDKDVTGDARYSNAHMSLIKI